MRKKRKKTFLTLFYFRLERPALDMCAVDSLRGTRVARRRVVVGAVLETVF